MPKLNFYDTDAVKAFLLNTLVENKEVREDVDFERRQSQTWFTQYGDLPVCLSGERRVLPVVQHQDQL